MWTSLLGHNQFFQKLSACSVFTVVSRSVAALSPCFESATSSGFDFALPSRFGTTIFVFFVFAMVLEEFGQEALLCLAEEETHLFLLSIVFGTAWRLAQSPFWAFIDFVFGRVLVALGRIVE